MSIDEAIKKRWSVRTYKIDDVEKDLVRVCIKAATFAPSVKNGIKLRLRNF